MKTPQKPARKASGQKGPSQPGKTPAGAAKPVLKRLKTVGAPDAAKTPDPAPSAGFGPPDPASNKPVSLAQASSILPATGETPTAIVTQPGLSPSGAVSITRKVAAISRWREQYNPLRGLTLQRAVLLAESYPRGWYADLEWTYFFIEQTDPDLFALVDRRTSRLIEMDYSVKLAKKAIEGEDSEEEGNDNPDADEDSSAGSLRELAEEQAEYIRAKLEAIDNLYEAIEHLAMPTFRGFAHCEKWCDDNGDIRHLEIVDQWNIVRDGLRGGWKYNPRAWQTAYWGLGDELIIEPSNFLIRTVPRHINRIGLWKYISSNLCNKDWDAFVEIYGIPSGVVIGPPNVNTDNKDEFALAAETIAQGGSGYLPNGSEYKANDQPRGNSPFKERLEYLTEKLILAGTGGMLTMLARSGSGTLAGNAHSDVFEQLAKAEARKISEIFNRQLVKDWLDKGFPGQPQLAYFDLSAQEETKLGEIVAHISTLAAAGYQVDVDEVSERTGYTVTLKPGGANVDPKAETGVDGRNADPETGDPASIANRSTAPVDAGRAVFDRNSLRQLNAAQQEAVGPLLDRIAAFKDMPPEQLGPALQKFRADLPRLFADARLKSSDVAGVWQQVLSTALADGLADHPSQS